MNSQMCKPFMASGAAYTYPMPKKSRQLPRSTLAENVKYLRKARGWSQDHLGKLAKIPQKTISNMESGKHNPSLDDVTAIAEVFGLNLWHVIMPNLPRDLMESPTISKLVDGYVAADPSDRKLLDMIASRNSDPGSEAS